MTGASITYRAHVLCFGSSSIDREPVAVRTCARLRWRAHSDINPGSQQAINPASHQSVAPSLTVVSNVIVAVSSPRWRRLAARTLERSGPNTGARALAAIFSLGGGHRRLITNFCRAFKAAGKPAFLPLVHDANQPTRGFFHRFKFPEVLSFLTAHAHQHERSYLKCLTNALKGQSR